MNEKDPMSLVPSSHENEIILYQPDATVKLEVRLENETVWLTQQQIANLFDKDQSVIARHISNIFKEQELEKESNMQILHNTFSKYKPTQIYSLDVIISVGYRVKSKRGTQFRIWANKVLKDHLLRGYSINQRLILLEDRIDRRLSEYDRHLLELDDKVDFFVRTSLPPREGVFFDGQIFDAYTLICDLIRSAQRRIIMVDNYIDDSVFRLLDKRAAGVPATIFTPSMSRILTQDLERHNAQYPPIDVVIYRKAHDRFLIVDDTVYHIGASFKDLGKKLCAFSRMELWDADGFIAYLGS